MNDRLIIDEVHAERFGGLANTSLALGGNPLVVVHGPNESGKTTFASLMSWLLVGPTDDNIASLRFGKPTDQLAGRLTGSLNGEALRIEGVFKLLQKGLPNTGGMAVQHAGQRLALDAWRTLLGGIDPKVLSATYRLWGADLHADENVLVEVTQAALAGLGGSRRIGDVLASLKDQSAALLTARAEGTESFSTLSGRRSTLEGDIKAIGENASRYRQLQEQLETVSAGATAKVLEASTLREREAAIVTLQSVTRERLREKAVREELASLPEVPDEWASIVDDVAGFTAAAEAADAATEQARVADLAVMTAAAQAGLTDDEATQLRVTHGTVTTVQVALTQLETARSRLQEAEGAEGAAQDAVTNTERAANQASAACPEATAEALTARPVTEADVRDLRAAVADWATAERHVVNARAAVSAQQAKVSVATGARDQAQAVWERFGTGVAAQQWRVTPPPAAPPTTVATPVRPWPALAVAGAVALVAVVALPRWAALAVTAAAFVGMVVALRRTRTVEVPTAAPTTEPVVDPDQVAAANAVVAAETAVDTAEAELQRLEADLERLGRDLGEPMGAVAVECRRLGVEAADTPGATTDLIDRVLAASAAWTTVGTALAAHARAVRDLQAAHDAVDAHVTGLCDALAAAGVPAHLPCEAAATTIDRLRQVTDLVAQRHAAERVADHAREAFETWCAPLGAAATERSRAALVAEATRFGDLHATRQQLLTERNDLNHTINTRFSERPAAKALASESRSDAEWAAELAQVREGLQQAEDDRDELHRERGELQQAMDHLMNSDELTTKRLELGSVIERADEQLLAGAVLLAARSLLARTAAERRRTHQPALVAQASRLLRSVAVDWHQLLVDPHDDGSAEVTVIDAAGVELATNRLSTGARALTHLALRLATAELDAQRRRVRFPIICDDPLVHLDDDRALAVMPLLAQAAADGHQVIVFTCHGRTVDAGRAAGAHVVDLV